MAEMGKTKPGLGLRQIALLTVAAIIFYKSQRVTCDQASSEVGDGNSTQICPDYCNLAPDSATRSKAPFPRWYYDPVEGNCKRFRWGGRGGNRNRFFKRADCEETCSKCTSNDGPKGNANEQDSVDD